jgi:hypothetical protein
MSLFSKISPDLRGEEEKAAMRAQELLEEECKARIGVARAHSRWREIDEVDLVARGRGLLVSATTDEVFAFYRGAVFVPGSSLIVSDRTPLAFFVRGDEIIFLESTGKTWSQIVEERERRKRRATE